jgi:hypothetical protein
VAASPGYDSVVRPVDAVEAEALAERFGLPELADVAKRMRPADCRLAPARPAGHTADMDHEQADPDTTILHLPAEGGFGPAIKRFVSALPEGPREKVKAIARAYLFDCPDGGRGRLNGRTAAQIIAEYGSTPPTVIAEGQTDGTKWTLYDAPPTPKSDG